MSKTEFWNLKHENERLKSQIDEFWIALERSWNIEPREYFEKEIAGGIGFGDSPMAMAVHHMWKRSRKPIEVVEETANQIFEWKAYDRIKNSLTAVERKLMLQHAQQFFDADPEYGYEHSQPEVDDMLEWFYRGWISVQVFLQKED